MNTAKKYDYDYYGFDNAYYDNLAESLKSNAQEEALKRYKKQNVQSAQSRILSSGMIIVLFFVAILPFSFIIYRNAKIHEVQNDVYKINAAIKDYDTKSNEIKERLESNTSLDDLEVYAKEQVGMIKANSSRVIILKDMDEQIKYPSTKFSIAKVSEDYQEW